MHNPSRIILVFEVRLKMLKRCLTMPNNAFLHIFNLLGPVCLCGKFVEVETVEVVFCFNVILII